MFMSKKYISHDNINYKFYIYQSILNEIDFIYNLESKNDGNDKSQSEGSYYDEDDWKISVMSSLQRRGRVVE